MDIRFIGVVKDTKKTIIGYRLLDIDDKSVKDVPSTDLLSVLKRGEIKIVGLELKGNKVVGSNGSIDRYPIIINKNVPGSSPLIVITQLLMDDEILGYKIADWKGSIINSSLSDVVKYAKNNGISNGAVKKVGDKEFVSSISGEYDKVYAKSQRKITEDIEKTIWSIKDFEKYMKSNGNDYIIRPNALQDRHEIEFLCRNAKMLKYPLEVSLINNMFIPEGSLAELLILSPSIKEVAHDVLAKANNLKRIVLQEGIKSINVGGISGGSDKRNSLKEVSFPTSLESIVNGLSRLENITELDMSSTQLTSLSYCFNNLNNLTKLSLPNSLKEIYRSFRQVQSLQTVRFPDQLITLSSGCFMESDIRVADLSNCTKLKTFGVDVLRDSINLTEVILPDSIEEIGFNALSNCKKLTHVNIPKNLQKIEGSAFYGFKLESFTVTDKMITIGNSVFTEETVILFDDSNRKVKSSLISSPGYNKIILSDNITLIEVYAFSENTRLHNINIPKGLSRIENGAFRLCDNLMKIDLQDASNLKYIGDSAFTKCNFSNIILPEGLEIMGAGCFESCERLEYVVLPKSLEEIGKAAFNKIGEKVAVGTTFYVYDKSIGLKYCKRNNLRYIIINSLDDVYNIQNNDREIGKSKEAKMKMLLSTNDIHRELFTTEYLNYADILFRVYNHVTDELMRNEQSEKIDTSKFISFPLGGIKIVKDYINYEADTLENMADPDRLECLAQYTEDNLSSRFITLCNYVTKLIPFNHTPFTTSSLEYLETKADIDHATIYYDNCCSILLLRVKDKDASMNNDVSLIVVVTIGFNIKFVGVVDQNVDMCFHRVLNNSHVIKTKPTSSITDLLIAGDILEIKLHSTSKYNTVSGAPLPFYIHKQVMKNIDEHLIVVGHDSLESVKAKMGGINVKADLMCKDTGKIVTVQGKTEDNYVNKIRSIKELSNILVMDVQNFSTMSKESERRITAGLEYTNAKRLFERKSQGDKYFDRLKQLPGAFDTDPSYEWEVSQLLNKVDTSHLEELSVAMVKLTLDTGLFTKIRKSLKDIKQTGREAKAYSLEGGRYAIVEFQLKKDVKSKKVINGLGYYVTGLIDTQESESNLQDFYISNKSLAFTIELLLKLKETGKQIPIIDNVGFYSKSMSNDYVIIQHSNYSLYQDDYDYECYLVISKSDGGIYLMGADTSDNKTMYKILRFKTLESALKHCCWMFGKYGNYNAKPNKNDLKDIQLKDDIVDALNFINNTRFHSTKTNKKPNGIRIIRQAILDGLPNGAYIQCGNMELFDDVAKQTI